MLYTHAGPGDRVASTKTFATQMVACYLVALYLAQVRGTMFPDEIAAQRAASWPSCPSKVDRVLGLDAARSASWPRQLADAPTCCSSDGTWATRSRWKVRSS